MSASIFISFASQDRKVANTLCKALEGRGFKCWIASRDIAPGENFQIAIVRAIRNAKMMLLVFTANSNASDEMSKELALASQQKLIVVPLRIDDVRPNDAFEYEFATRQWIDFFADWETAIEQLAQRISAWRWLPMAPARRSARSRGCGTLAMPAPTPDVIAKAFADQPAAAAAPVGETLSGLAPAGQTLSPRPWPPPAGKNRADDAGRRRRGCSSAAAAGDRGRAVVVPARRARQARRAGDAVRRPRPPAGGAGGRRGGDPALVSWPRNLSPTAGRAQANATTSLATDAGAWAADAGAGHPADHGDTRSAADGQPDARSGAAGQTQRPAMSVPPASSRCRPAGLASPSRRKTPTSIRKPTAAGGPIRAGVGAAVAARAAGGGSPDDAVRLRGTRRRHGPSSLPSPRTERVARRSGAGQARACQLANIRLGSGRSRPRLCAAFAAWPG